MSRRAILLAATVVAASVVRAAPAAALPTMIRLGYTDCAACHLSPQGGGPLNAYGRGIDQGQSLRGGEYKPSPEPWVQTLSLDGRITQDVRVTLQRQETWATDRPSTSLFRPRFMYRNVTAINDAFRVAATVTAETQSAPRPALSYDPGAQPSSLFVNTALLHYRVSETVEVAAGRDQLPSGVNLPDLALFIKARNRLGYYDAPAQVKVFWNAKRFHVSPYAFHDGGYEQPAERESGAGALAEMDLLGNQKTVVGLSLLRGSATNGDRRTVGGYARLGFGSWGILAEHDVTSRDRSVTAVMAEPLPQTASYAQVFWAAREWLVASAIGERLRVDVPFAEQLNAGKLELAARLASQATLGVSARVQHDTISGRYTRSIVLQAAFKTVQ